MGVPMEDIHSATTSSTNDDKLSHENKNGSSGSSREELLDLMKQKDYLEAELSTLGSVLDSHGVNMNTTLLTFDGYPRNDIDIAQIRTTRAKIIHLRNDHKWLMEKIEKGLQAHHQSMSANSATRPAMGPATGTPSRPLVEAPFAIIDSVAPSSPAYEAGLLAYDKIKRFGTIGALNHEKLSKLATEVQSNEGRPIKVLLIRKDGETAKDVEVSLTPRRDWGGRGMLGCHLLPL